MSNLQQLKRFHLRNIKPNATVAIVGKRNTGKTTILKWMIYYNYKRIRMPMVFSQTAGMNGDFNKMVPELFIHEEYDNNIMKTFMKDQALLKQKIKDGECHNKVKKLGYIVLDDIIGDKTKLNSDPNFLKMFFMGRHLESTIVLSVQSLIAVPPKIRENLDYIIYTCSVTDKRKRTFYDNFFNGSYATFGQFKGLLRSVLSKKFHWAMFDNTNRESAGRISDYMYWGKCKDPRLIPKKKTGINFIWKMNKKYYNKDWFSKTLIDDDNTKTKKDNMQVELVE